MAGERYRNASKRYESRFLTFEEGARLEIMKTTSINSTEKVPGQHIMGLTHFAFSTGSEDSVDKLTTLLEADGHPVID